MCMLMLGIFMVWFVLRFLWHVMEFLERVLFTGRW